MCVSMMHSCWCLGSFSFLTTLIFSHLRQEPSLLTEIGALIDIAIDGATRSVTSSLQSSSGLTASRILLEPTVAFTLLEDACEMSTIGRLEALWKLVEERRNDLYPLVHASTMQRSRLSLLRVTSGLLRRLSRTLDTVLCGRILLFLAFILPLSERSGVNVTGLINTENATSYDGQGEDTALIESAAAWKPPPPKALPVRINAAAAAASQAPVEIPTVDGRFHLEVVAQAVSAAFKAAENGNSADSPVFYRAFWRLQHFLYKPAIAQASPESWSFFVGSTRAVLRAFEKEDEDAGIARSISDAVKLDLNLPALASKVAEVEEGEEGETTSKPASNKPHSVPSMPPAIPTLSAVTVSHLDHDQGFERYKPDESSLHSSTGQLPLSIGGDLFDIKYLTSPTLLSLELKDQSLRRHVILQILIGMQFFLFPRKVATPPPGATPALIASTAAINNAAAMMFSTAQNDLAPLRDLCYILLRRTQPDGPVFVRSISSVLAREVYWQNWKAGGALSFEKSSTRPRQVALGSSALTSIDEAPATGLKRSRSGQAVAQGSTSAATARKNRFGTLGAPQRPSQRPLNWASIGLSRSLLDICRDPIRAVRPQLLAYIVPLRVALDYRTGIEEEFSPAKDRLYVWRGLRLFAMENLEAFFEISQGKSFGDAVVSALKISIPERPKPEVPKEELDSKMETTEDGESKTETNEIVSVEGAFEAENAEAGEVDADRKGPTVGDDML